jgi:hypothetical protein
MGGMVHIMNTNSSIYGVQAQIEDPTRLLRRLISGDAPVSYAVAQLPLI